MTRLSWLYLLLALGLASAVGYFTLQSARRSPIQLLEEAVRRTSGPERDLRLAIADLDLAVRLAEVDASEEVAARIRLERARVLAEMEAWSRARADLETVLERYRPGDLAVESQLILADLRCGDPQRALRRSEKVLARDPDRVDALTYRGQVLVHLADEAMRECESLLHRALPDERAKHAIGLAHRIAGLTADEPLRVAHMLELRGLFTSAQEMVVRDVLRLLDRASGQIALAREALASAFRGPPLRQTLDDYMRLLERSGRPAEMVAFGLAAVHQPGAAGYPPFYERLLQALRAEGRPDLAAEAMERHFPEGVLPTPGLYDVWTDVLYLDRRWHEVTGVGARLREMPGRELQSRGFFYTGIAHTRTEQYTYAPVLLTRYVGRDPVEARPGDLATAWHMLALCYRQQDLLVPEKNALRAALQADPEGGHQAGLGWRRLAAVLRTDEPGSFHEIDHALTMAVRLLPELASELVPEWEAVCREHLEASQVDLRAEYERLSEGQRDAPARPASAYELLALARMHAARRNHAGVIACTRRLLADYPGFLPGLDLLLEATLSARDLPRAAEIVLERLALDPADKRTLLHAASIPPETWTREQVLRLMRLDPEGHGRMRIARFLHASGRDREALDGLLAVDPQRLGDESRLLAGRLMLELGRIEGIDALLEGISAGSPERVEALPLRIEAALLRNDPERARERIAALVAERPLATGGWLRLVDRMLFEGHEVEAAALLQLLDARQETRDGEILLRRGVAEMLLDRPDEALEHLARADAFLEDGRVGIGLLQVALERAQWRVLPLLADEITAAGALPPLRAAALDVIAGRAEAALERVERAEDRGSEPLWLLVESAARALRGEPLPGSGDGAEPDAYGGAASAALLQTRDYLAGSAGERDPRQAMGVVLALLDPVWRPVAHARARAQIGGGGDLWPSYVAARARLDAGKPEAALDILRQIMRPDARFAPAWDLHERALEQLAKGSGVAELGLPTARLSDLRRTIFGPRPGDEASELWRQVVQAELAGESERATELATAAVAVALDPVGARLRLARLHLRRQELQPALAALEEAVDLQEPVSDSILVSEVLARWPELDRAVTSPADARKLRALQESVVRRFPRDPLAAMLLARADLADRQLSGAVALARAFERLQAFRRTTGEVPLEQLRPGATRAWFEFLVARDPARAEALVHGELLQTPGSRDLWRMLGDAQAARGRRQEAIDTYETLLRMLPDGATGRSLLTLLARSGRRTRRVQELVDDVVRMERLPGPDIALELERAVALVLESARTREEGIALLSELWERREGAGDPAAAAEIGIAYGTALCWRGGAGDGPAARRVLESSAEAVLDPSRRNLVQALANLASRMH